MSASLRQLQNPDIKVASPSRLDREGAVIIDPKGMYTIQYLQDAYPEQIFKSVLRQCPIVQKKYIYGSSWVRALEKVVCVELEDFLSSEKRLIDIPQAAAITQTSDDNVARLIAVGALPASDMSPDPGTGRALWRIRPQDVQELITKRRTGKQPTPVAKIRPVAK